MSYVAPMGSRLMNSAVCPFGADRPKWDGFGVQKKKGGRGFWEFWEGFGVYFVSCSRFLVVLGVLPRVLTFLW